MVARNGKIIGFQKDWELWGKLAKQLIKVSNSDNQKLAGLATNVSNTANKQADEKLAILSTKLAKQLTKVSSPIVTQKKKETITKERETISLPSFENNGKEADVTPYREIMAIFNEICGPAGLRKAKELHDSRRTWIRARWRTHPNIATFKELFEKVVASDFLTGKGTKPYFATFDWLMNPTNWAKVMEGNYDNRGGKVDCATTMADLSGWNKYTQPQARGLSDAGQSKPGNGAGSDQRTLSLEAEVIDFGGNAGSRKDASGRRSGEHPSPAG
jgi:hypothetical protein